MSANGGGNGGSEKIKCLGEENASEQARILHNQTRWGVKLHRTKTARGDFNIPMRYRGKESGEITRYIQKEISRL